MNIREAILEDSKQIAQIYNYYVENTHHTFETEPITSEEMRKRISKTLENYPYLVAEEKAEILGYAYATQYKSRSAYRHSVEVSVYVKNAVRRKGIGTNLYDKLLKTLESTNEVHAIIAGISLPNDASIKLHEKMGFEKVAHFKEVGYKLGRWIDVGYWEKIKL